ncbi:MAG: T9SS type A sorting domain-containing protein [Gemmatimonadales bacterium]|nr:T9SS type A sorting domain-containing protein [Gemmatimonadales bacterium]
MFRISILSLFFLFLTSTVFAGNDYRWNGHDFVFCFVTDDGARTNIGWADTAQVMDFKFTIAVNAREGVPNPNFLSGAEAHQLYLDGMEIAQHGFSHGFLGLPCSCSVPPRGSLLGYFFCTELEESLRMQFLAVEVERDSVASWGELPSENVTVVAYPRHLHNKALIDVLIAEGFIGARTGGRWNYSINSYCDFNVQARNSWDGGISLFRVPTHTDSAAYFGNHSADPPVHKSYEEFYAVAQPIMETFQASGGMLVLYTHHFGDDDHTFGNYNYGSGGVTKQDLAWIVDLVRANNGVVMGFGEAVEYYRARSHMVDLDGDYVWVIGPSAVGDDLLPGVGSLRNFPNPFNPRTRIFFRLDSPGPTRVSVYDPAGRLVRVLAQEMMQEGDHFLEFDGRSAVGDQLPAGIYFLRVVSGSWSEVRKIALLK